MESLIARARRSLGHRGLARSLRLLGAWARFRLRQGWRAPRPHGFDLEFGVATAIADAGGARKGASPSPGHDPVDPSTFLRLLRAIPLGEGEFTFLDFGCGAGRALLLAAEFPFARILGVECARDLQRAAERNLALFHSPRQRCFALGAVWEDAVAWEFPVAPSVFYLCEPFYEPVLRQVAARIRQSLADAPRAAYVLYLGGWYRAVWEEPSDFDILATTSEARLYRFRGALRPPPPARP